MLFADTRADAPTFSSFTRVVSLSPGFFSETIGCFVDRGSGIYPGRDTGDSRIIYSLAAVNLEAGFFYFRDGDLGRGSGRDLSV